MPRGGHNRAPAATKRRYFELIRQGAKRLGGVDCTKRLTEAKA